MLAVTPPAAEAIKQIVDHSEAPDSAGVRISVAGASADGAGPAAVEMRLAESPETEDQVVDEAGAQLFVAPSAADLLEDKRLEVEPEGEELRFVFAPQAG